MPKALYPPEYESAKREGRLHDMFRVVRCALCPNFHQIARSKWSKWGWKTVYIPASEALQKHMKVVFPSYDANDTSLPLSICRPCRTHLSNAASHKAAALSSSPPPLRRLWSTKEEAEIERRFAIAARVKSIKKAPPTCTGKDCRICVGALHTPDQLADIFQVNDEKSSKPPPDPAKSVTRSNSACSENPQFEELPPKKRRRRSVVVIESPPKKMTVEDLAVFRRNARVSTRAIARGAEGQRDRPR